VTKHNDPNEIAISEHELNAMTAELDLLHNETFPGVQKTFSEVRANLAHLRTSSGGDAGRRTFLLGLGGAALVGGVAACSSSGGGAASSTPAQQSTTPAAPKSSSGGSQYTGDLQVVALAAALENLAVAAYQGAIKMAGAGKLGKVPPAVATFAATAMKQHQDHAAGWNSVLTKSHLKPVTTPALTITKTEVAKLGQAKTVVDVAKLALTLEDAAAATYQFAVGAVNDPAGIVQAATIQPVEAMHAAILNFVLGQYPVPMSDIGTSGAVTASMFTG
jgi:hypothetical protein